jgi:diacylglycerol kinase (ATP)
MPTLARDVMDFTRRPTHIVVPAPPQTAAKTRDTATLIVNTKARRGQEWFEKAQVCLRESGVRIDDAHALENPSELPNAVQAAVRRGVKRVIVGGGDGTFRTVANLLAQTDVNLGVLPLGTVNDFARNLGIAAEVEAACRVIADGCIARIDVGQANDNVFLLTASVGFSAQSQTALKPQLKRILGPFGYLVASLVALRRLRQLDVTVSAEGHVEHHRVLQAGAIKGHEWMGGKCQIPGMSLETGHLAFYALPPQPKTLFLRTIRDLMRGKFYRTPGLISFATCEVCIDTPTPQPLVLDGDLCGQTPVRMRVLPEALRVFVPSSFPDV